MAKEEKKNEDEGEAVAAPAPVASGGKKKIMLIVGFVVLLVLAAGVPTVVLVMKKNAAKAAELAADAAQATQDAASLAPEGADDEEEATENEERMGMIAPLDTFVVNLAGGKYLRAQIQVEFQGQDVPGKFTSRMVPIRDGLIAMLTKKSEADLASGKGKEDLKTEVKDLINEQLHKEEIKQVYFTQFVIE